MPDDLMCPILSVSKLCLLTNYCEPIINYMIRMKSVTVNKHDTFASSWSSVVIDAIDDEYGNRCDDKDMGLCKLFDRFDPQPRRENISDNNHG